MNAGVQGDGVLLQDNLLLNKSVNLLFKEVALVDIVRLELLVVLLKVGDVFDDLLQDIVSRLSRVVLKSCALASEELHFFLVVIEKLDGVFGVSL